MKMTKKTEERIKAGVAKFKKVLEIAKARDLNESDTVAIITDMLADVFGYDKYLEVTSELAIRGTFCDLAIKLNEKFEYLMECKAIGIDLKENHMRQAIGYGANKGIQWIILTNGIDWQIYRLRFEQPIAWDLVARFDFTTLDLKNERDVEKLFVVTKEGVEKNARTDLYEKMQCINRYVCGQLLLQEPCVSLLRRELKKMAEGISVEDGEVISLLKEGVLRRDLIEGEDAEAAEQKVAKFYRQACKKSAAKKQMPVVESKDKPVKPAMSLADQLLAEGAPKLADGTMATMPEKPND